MKNSKKWITLAEVVVSFMIFSMVIFSITSFQSSLIVTSQAIESQFKIKKFWSFVWDIIKDFNIPNYPDGQVFYIKYDSDSYSFETSDLWYSEMYLWFFREDEKNDYTHKITKIWENTLNWSIFTTYKIEISYWENSNIYYITK